MTEYFDREIDYIKKSLEKYKEETTKKIEALETKYDLIEGRVSKVEWKLDEILTTSRETNRMIKQAIIGAVVTICITGIAGLIWAAVTGGGGA